MKEIKHRWILLVVVALVGFFLDWFTKHLAETNLSYGVAQNVFGDYLQLLLVYNKGAVFGMDPKQLIANFPTNHFFFIFNTIAMLILVIYYKYLPLRERTMHWGIALILPGAMGNLFDRVLHPAKGVVDFIKMGISADTYWPIYNLADVYVTAGVILLVYCFLTEDKRRKEAEKAVLKVSLNENQNTN